MLASQGAKVEHRAAGVEGITGQRDRVTLSECKKGRKEILTLLEVGIEPMHRDKTIREPTRQSLSIYNKKRRRLKIGGTLPHGHDSEEGNGNVAGGGSRGEVLKHARRKIKHQVEQELGGWAFTAATNIETPIGPVDGTARELVRPEDTQS